MRTVARAALVMLLEFVATTPVRAQPLMAAGQPAQLVVRAAGNSSLRITLGPTSFGREFPVNPAVVDRKYGSPEIRLRELSKRIERKIGSLVVGVRPDPLTVTIKTMAGQLVQDIVFEADGSLSFKLDQYPVLGMGEGGPLPDKSRPWREQPVQFDRRGALDTMEPRWQSDMYGSRNPVAMLFGTGGWGLFVAAPWVQVDLRRADRGVFLPWRPTGTGQPQIRQNQEQNASKGLPPVDGIVPGLYDLFVFDARDPAKALGDFSAITGPAAMPPRWALGYMQSHRTLDDETQMIGIIDTFRSKNIPVDALIYLGTGFSPRGWNTRQPSFDFNPDVFKRVPATVLADLHARNVKVVVHMVP
jgi:alpha-glucosidase/alpha-D-xyloside xylohydrolase